MIFKVRDSYFNIKWLYVWFVRDINFNKFIFC